MLARGEEGVPTIDGPLKPSLQALLAVDSVLFPLSLQPPVTDTGGSRDWTGLKIGK